MGDRVPTRPPVYQAPSKQRPQPALPQAIYWVEGFPPSTSSYCTSRVPVHVQIGMLTGTRLVLQHRRLSKLSSDYLCAAKCVVVRKSYHRPLCDPVDNRSE